MPFFERSSGGFYAGVADRPGPPPALSGGGPGRRPAPADAVPRPVLGRPAHVRRGARPSAAPDAPRPVRDRPGGARSLAGPHARRHRRARARRRTSPTSSSATSRWPPRRCATATEGAVAAGRLAGGGPVHGRDRRRGTASGGRHWRTRDESSTAANAKRGKTVHGEAANAGHRVLAPDDAEVEAYLETALNAPAPDRSPGRPPGRHRPPSDRATGRRPRLRQPVRAADRPARPRARRLLGAPAARHPVRRARAARHPRRSSCRAARTRSTTRARRKPDPAIWCGPDPGPRASATAPS